MKIKTLRLFLENCEVIEIKGNTIGDFCLDKIRHVVCRIAMNAFDSYDVADNVTIELFPEANVKYNSFGRESDITAFERLTGYPDITQIDIEWDNGRSDNYFVDFDGEYNNSNQTTYQSEAGNLYIVIGEGMTIYDAFGYEYIHDIEYMEFTKDMYDIGIEEEPEHVYSRDDLPEYYRYAILSEDNSGGYKSATVVRVPVGDDWKFVYEHEGCIIHFPTNWAYYNSKLGEYIAEGHKGDNFSIEKLKELYPMKQEEKS